jgi:hypothetical protein
MKYSKHTFSDFKEGFTMTNVASNEAPKTPAPGESKPAPQQQNAGEKPAKPTEQQK